MINTKYTTLINHSQHFRFSNKVQLASMITDVTGKNNTFCSSLRHCFTLQMNVSLRHTDFEFISILRVQGFLTGMFHMRSNLSPSMNILCSCSPQIIFNGSRECSKASTSQYSSLETSWKTENWIYLDKIFYVIYILCILKTLKYSCIPRNPMAPPVTQPLYTAFFQSDFPLCCKIKNI